MGDRQTIIKNICRKVESSSDSERDGILIQDFLEAIGFDILYNEYKCEEYLSYKQVVEFIGKLAA